MRIKLVLPRAKSYYSNFSRPMEQKTRGGENRWTTISRSHRFRGVETESLDPPRFFRFVCLASSMDHLPVITTDKNCGYNTRYPPETCPSYSLVRPRRKFDCAREGEKEEHKRRVQIETRLKDWCSIKRPVQDSRLDGICIMGRVCFAVSAHPFLHISVDLIKRLYILCSMLSFFRVFYEIDSFFSSFRSLIFPFILLFLRITRWSSNEREKERNELISETRTGMVWSRVQISRPRASSFNEFA